MRSLNPIVDFQSSFNIWCLGKFQVVPFSFLRKIPPFSCTIFMYSILIICRTQVPIFQRQTLHITKKICVNSYFLFFHNVNYIPYKGKYFCIFSAWKLYIPLISFTANNLLQFVTNYHNVACTRPGLNSLDLTVLPSQSGHNSKQIIARLQKILC